MLPSSYYPETSSTRDSSSRNIGHLLMPDGELNMPFLYSRSSRQGQRMPPQSDPSNLESSPLSDDEKRERIRLQRLMRHPDHLEWFSDPESPTNETPRETFSGSETDDDWLLPMM
ncbi:hypothetical protein M5D96_007848 [Drosophila gunungcola]|uniref:Uncharacterized protein n=1 Tax=Drosophila gunungcola TaxID=103775 RepID=A0A9P9YLI8_9MUSC|nr:hypothetical protein M5D96_007848 [Drosophila gunungcola]